MWFRRDDEKKNGWTQHVQFDSSTSFSCWTMLSTLWFPYLCYLNCWRSRYLLVLLGEGLPKVIRKTETTGAALKSPNNYLKLIYAYEEGLKSLFINYDTFWTIFEIQNAWHRLSEVECSVHYLESELGKFWTFIRVESNDSFKKDSL